ncbi:MAG: amylo-alpha-1,6-glucosidase, partial [Steroidobacteraceae bacterium]
MRRPKGLVEELFWWESEGTYYLGLDGLKRPLRTVASNPAHLLWCGAVEPDRARETAQRLPAGDMWSGWGVRTISSGHPSYNLFSYQLGSVWPHDNVIAAAGFRRDGLDQEATKVIRATFDAAARFRTYRLPELFAGIERDTSN